MSHQTLLESIDQLIADLSAVEPQDDAVYNQYACHEADNAIRRANLRLYLQHMAQRRPGTLLVMEAPGYRGCRLTGVPVTSRKVLLEGIPELNLFGIEQGYSNTTDAGFEDIYGEQSATIVWSTLARLGQIPLIWNSFPFHPRQSGAARSNRKPLKAETWLGAAFLERLLAAFQPRQIIAVGSVAAGTLAELGLPGHRVRHPAQGGKHEFAAGLARLLG